MSKTKMLVESAILIAIAIVLEFVSKVLPFQLPFGGGVTIASMLPVIIIGYKYGVKWGLMSGFVYSIMEIMVGFQTISIYFIGEDVMPLPNALLVTFLDYTVACTVVGLAGLFKNKLKTRNIELMCGCVFTLFLRFLAHFTSGALFWGAYAEWFFTQDGMGGFGESVLSTFSGVGLNIFYSAFYNGSYMLPEIIITTVVAGVMMKSPQLHKNIVG